MFEVQNSKDKINTYEMESKVILFNTQNVQWTALAYNEYELYKNCMKHGTFGLNEKTKKLFMKLLVRGIININPPEISKDMIQSEYLQTPMTVYFEPTQYCNLKCVYCYAEACTSKEIIYSTDNSKKLLSKICEYPNVKTIVFTGGEPLLRKDCLELAEYVYQEKGIHPCILTNGVLINEKNVERFKIFDKVTISLDGHTPELHEKTRGKNTFYKVVESIKLLRKKGISVTVTTVISKVNQEFVTQIMDFVKKDLDVEYHNMSTHISFGRGADSNIECSEMEVKQYRDTYFQYLCESNSEKIETLLRPNIRKGEYRIGCGAGCGEIFIKDNGEVYPCRLLNNEKYYLGNLNQTTLKDIVISKRLQDIKRSFDVNQIESCSHCDYKYICGGGCRSVHSAYTGSPQKSSDTLCNMLKNEIDCAIVIQNGFNPITRKELEKNEIYVG